MALAYLYNFISIPLRIAFPVWGKGQRFLLLWIFVDYFSDVLYLIDVCFFQTRIKYLENGLWVVRTTDEAKVPFTFSETNFRPNFV